MMVKRDKIYIVTDGACRDNPGPSAVGYGIYDENLDVIEEDGKYIGEATNNEAEYEALILALDRGTEYCRNRVEHFTDSQLVVNQLEGEWAIRADNLKELIDEVYQLQDFYESFTHKHLPRENERIQKIDEIANKVLDEEGF
ncbi:MAG: ribonuclease HI family protein [Thermoplasmatota archaeon]